MKKITISILTISFMFFTLTCFSGEPIKIASKNFTEQIILGQMMLQLLKNRGIPVVDKTNLGGTNINRNALLQGQTDIYMEYTGTAWLTFFKKKELVRDSRQLFNKVKAIDKKKNNLIWLEPCKFNNTYAIVMREDIAERYEITTLSEWANFIKKNPRKMTVAVGAEFYSRLDGFKGMMGHYNLTFGKDIPDSDVRKMEDSLTKKAIRDAKALCGMAFATDSEIIDFNLRVLKDDKNYFPIYNPAPVLRGKILKKYPKIKNILSLIGFSLDTKTMQRLNYKVNANNEKPASVAKDWLKGVGLIVSKRK